MVSHFPQETEASRKPCGWLFISYNLGQACAAAKLEGLSCLSWTKTPVNAKAQHSAYLVTVADCLTHAAGVEANSIWKQARFFCVSWGTLEFYSACLYLCNQHIL